MAKQNSKPAPQPEAPEQVPELVEVTLAKPHTHAGVDYAVGAKINVAAHDRDWLAAQQII